MRFLLWQQMLTIGIFVGMFVAYIFWAYRVLKGGRPLRSTIKRLVGLAVVGCIGWIIIGLVTQLIVHAGLSDFGTRYWVVDRTVYDTFGFPLREGYSNFLASVGVDYHWAPYMVLSTPPLIMLVLGELVIIADRLLASGPFSLHERSRDAGMAVAGVALLLAGVLMWPQAGRNPDMPYIPIPYGAINVTYSFLTGDNSAPATSFSVDDTSSVELRKLYAEALEGEGWQVESRPLLYRPPDPGTVVYSRGGKYLEISIPDGYSGSYARLILWSNSQAMVDVPH